ncbi:hypothetical protein L6248_01205 [Candidatus Parcubacteria bacterium]|nr:hypothetical protein [Candidatus Parcubacteria bacterium]
MVRRVTLITFCILLLFVKDLLADSIYLKNGNKVTGIVVRETEDSVEIKINIGAVVTFSRQDIDRIEKDTEDRRVKIEESWETAKAEREAKEIREDTYSDERSKRGLVEYRGDWVTPDERERLQAASIVEGADKGYGERKVAYSKDKGNRSSFARKLLKKGNWYKKETENFAIFYRDLEQAKIVSDKAEYYFEKITYDLG